MGDPVCNTRNEPGRKQVMIDELKVFRGKEYQINSHLSIRQPTLDEICGYGEKAYFGMVKGLCSTPADRKVEIWDALHVYWETVDEYDLFLSMWGSLCKMDLSILFGTTDMSQFKPVLNPKINSIVLSNQQGAVIDRAIYTLITDYLRRIHGFKKNVDVGYNDSTRDIMIEDDRDDQLKWASKPFRSMLQPLISSLTNCPEFKYRYDDVWDLPIGVFMDAVSRIQKHKNYTQLMTGIYSGCIDSKKIKKSEMDWMGELKKPS